MADMKRVSVSEKCMLCGLCEQENLSEVFVRGSSGKMEPLNNGLFDLEKYPQIAEVQAMCPAEAIQLDSEEIVTGDRNEILSKLNKMIYQELRDFPFVPPDEDDFRYESGVYQVAKIPARYKSAAEYRSDESAERAGLSAFKQLVWSQHRLITKQYVSTYKVKKLKKYFSYEEMEGNYYFDINKKIEQLLQNAYDLAVAATDGKIKLPDDFCAFDVKPDWGYDNGYLESYKLLEDFDYDLQSTGFFHEASYYDSWIDVDGDDRYYYNFEEAEAELRDDIDRSLECLMPEPVNDRVIGVTQHYHEKAKKILGEKLDILQNELKKHTTVDKGAVLEQELKSAYREIFEMNFPRIPFPSFDMDIDYNSDYRFYSESSCETAAEHRRERAYNDGERFIHRVPELLNEACMKCLGQALTQWKRAVMQAYDLSGTAYPQKTIEIVVGNAHTKMSLNDFNEISIWGDKRVEQFVNQELLHYGISVNDVKYMSEYDCKITILEDYDLKETLFGNLKEVNHRYCYMLSPVEFFRSAMQVSKECTKALQVSAFLQAYFEEVKQVVIGELKKVTGVSPA